MNLLLMSNEGVKKKHLDLPTDATEKTSSVHKSVFVMLL